MNSEHIMVYTDEYQLKIADYFHPFSSFRFRLIKCRKSDNRTDGQNRVNIGFIKRFFQHIEKLNADNGNRKTDAVDDGERSSFDFRRSIFCHESRKQR